jgi:uncharacterized integral membrane protein
MQRHQQSSNTILHALLLLLLLLLLLQQGKRLHNGSLWLGVAGLALMVILMGRRVKGSIM